MRAAALATVKIEEILEKAVPVGALEMDKNGRPEIKTAYTYRPLTSISGNAPLIHSVVRKHLDGRRLYDH